MENVSRFRALGSLCRQRAVFDPQNSWKHLGDAERWEHLAAVEISAHYQACNTAGSSETPNPAPHPNQLTSDGARTLLREDASRGQPHPLGGLSGCTIS